MTRITPLVGCATFAMFLMACPPTAPRGIEYCESAASRMVYLTCTSSQPKAANACRVAAGDGRDWHPRQIASAKTCDEIEELVGVP